MTAKKTLYADSMIHYANTMKEAIEEYPHLPFIVLTDAIVESAELEYENYSYERRYDKGVRLPDDVKGEVVTYMRAKMIVKRGWYSVFDTKSKKKLAVVKGKNAVREFVLTVHDNVATYLSAAKN